MGDLNSTFNPFVTPVVALVVAAGAVIAGFWHHQYASKLRIREDEIKEERKRLAENIQSTLIGETLDASPLPPPKALTIATRVICLVVGVVLAYLGVKGIVYAPQIKAGREIAVLLGIFDSPPLPGQLSGPGILTEDASSRDLKLISLAAQISSNADAELLALKLYAEGKPDKAVQVLDQWKTITSRQSFNSLMIQGNISFRNSEFIRATALFSDATRLNAESASAWRHLTVSALLARDFDAATSASNQAVELAIRQSGEKSLLHASTLLNRAGVYIQSAKVRGDPSSRSRDMEQASRDIEKCLTLCEGSPIALAQALLVKAELLTVTGSFASSLEVADRAKRLFASELGLLSFNYANAIIATITSRASSGELTHNDRRDLLEDLESARSIAEHNPAFADWSPDFRLRFLVSVSGAYEVVINDRASARQFAETALRVSRGLGDSIWETVGGEGQKQTITVRAAELAIERGEVSLSRTLALGILKANTSEFPFSGVGVRLRLVLAEAELMDGRTPEARKLVQEVLDNLPAAAKGSPSEHKANELLRRLQHR